MDDLLKDAIADAKAVRETALENAKIALEEAFTPRLQSMLSKKIQSEVEEDDQEEHDMEEDDMEEDEYTPVILPPVEAQTTTPFDLEQFYAGLPTFNQSPYASQGLGSYDDILKQYYGIG